MAGSPLPTIAHDDLDDAAFAALKKRLEAGPPQQATVSPSQESSNPGVRYLGQKWGELNAGISGAANSATLGWAPWLYDKVFGTGHDAADAAAMDEARYPKARVAGKVVGDVGLGAGVAKGIANTALRYAPPAVARVLSGSGFIGGAGNAAATSAAISTADQASKAARDEGDFKFLPILRDTAASVPAGGLAGMLFGRTAPNAVRTQVGPVRDPLPTTKADPSGTISPVPLRGPEALKEAGRGEQASAAERLRLDAEKQAGLKFTPSPEIAGRPGEIKAGQTKLDNAAADAAWKASQSAEDLQQRVPGWDALAPTSWPIRDELSRASGMPSTFGLPVSGAKDNALHALETLDRMRAQAQGLPAGSAQRAALERDMAIVQNRLERKLPETISAKKADEAATDFSKTWGDIPVEPKAPSDPRIPAALGGAALGGVMGGAGLNMVGLGGAGALGGAMGGAGLGAKIGGMLPATSVPFFANPGKIAGILEDPAAMQKVLGPLTFGRALQTEVPAGVVREGKGLIEGIAGDKKKRRRPAS